VENRVSFYAGCNPAAREPPKRRHFATNTVAAETRPFQPCAASLSQKKKTQGSKGGAFTPPLVGVGRRPRPWIWI